MISVDTLATLPTLGLRFLAGEAGGRRPVTWAHVCDLADPWNWVGDGDLVMTTGPGLPADPDEQAAWLSRLIDARISALVLALGPSSPKITEAMLDVARDRDFPVLSGEFDLQFVSLARAVIESSIEAERRRVATIKRLYDANGMAVEQGRDLDERLSVLERSSGWGLCLWDSADDRVVFSGAKSRSVGLDRAPAEAEQTVRLTGDPTLQLVASRLDAATDRLLLEHVVGLLAMEFRYRAAEQDRLRRSGQALLLGLLDESITPAAVWPELAQRGLTGTLVVACWQSAADAELAQADLHRRVWLGDRVPLLLEQGRALLAVVPSDLELVEKIAEVLGPDVVTGLSSPLAANSSFPEVARQARLSVSRAIETGTQMVSYGESWQEAAAFPTTLAGVRGLVRGVLGAVVDYDRENSTELITSIRTFLDNDGNWSRSAEQLHIHRQTLVYRMNKVTDLAGIAPASSQGTALMWFALESARRAGIDIADIRPD